MLKLIFSDLKTNKATWLGAFFVAITCGYIGGWVISILGTAQFYVGAVYKNINQAGTILFLFSIVAGLAVISAVAKLTVDAQRKSYALWQLVNVSPRKVIVVVLAQLFVVAILGAICGTLLSGISFSPLFPLVFSARKIFEEVIPRVDLSSMPIVWLGVACIFLFGGLKAARTAGRTTPLQALTSQPLKKLDMTWIRLLLFAVLLTITVWFSYSIIVDGPNNGMDRSIYLPILLVGTLVPIAPVLFLLFMRIWTLLVPQRCVVWFLARRMALYNFSLSTSVQTPIMVGFGMVAGILTIINTMKHYATDIGITNFNGLDLTSTILAMGGPILLSAVGAAASIGMTARSRTSDVKLLAISGASPRTLILAAICETFIHSANATFVGIIAVAASNYIVSKGLMILPFVDITITDGLIVSLLGFIMIAITVLTPTLFALSRKDVIQA